MNILPLVRQENSVNSILCTAYSGKTPLQFTREGMYLCVRKYIEGMWHKSALKGLPGRISEGEECTLIKLIQESVFSLEGPFVTASPAFIGGNNLPSLEILRDGLALQNWLKANPRVKELKISGQNVGHEVVKAITYAARNSSISTLWMDHCSLDEQDIELFAKGLTELPTTWLDLQRNKIGNKGIAILAPQISDSHLRNLNLNYNHINDDGIKMLAEELSSTPLFILHLSGNPLKTGAKELATGTIGSQLLKLNLADCQIGDSEAESLAAALPHNSICHLMLDGNDIGDQGVIALAKALPSTSITRLSLSGNTITQVGIDALKEYLPNSWVVELSLANNPASAQAIATLKPLLEANLKKLKKVFGKLKDKDAATRNLFIQHKIPAVLLDHAENTPLHIAVLLEDHALATALLNHGAIQSFNGSGSTPLDYAKANKDQRMIAILQQDYSERSFKLACQWNQTKKMRRLGNQLSLFYMENQRYSEAEEIIKKIFPLGTTQEQGRLLLRWATCLLQQNQRANAFNKIVQAQKLLIGSDTEQLLQDFKSPTPIKLKKLDLQEGIALDIMLLLQALKRDIEVTQLNLGQNPLGKFSQFLPLLQQFKGVQTLHLWQTKLSDENFLTLLPVLKMWSQLSHLNLACNNLTAVSLKECHSQLTHLKQLEIWGNPIGDVGFKTLLETFPSHSSLTSIDCTGFSISSDSMTVLSQFLSKNRSLVHLRVNLESKKVDETPLIQALQDNYTCIDLGIGFSKEVVDLLQRNEGVHQQFLQAACTGDLPAINKIIAQGVPLSIQNKYGDTTIHLAVRHNQYGVILEWMKRKGPQEPNLSGQTPIEIAKLHANNQALISLGAHPIVNPHPLIPVVEEPSELNQTEQTPPLLLAVTIDPQVQQEEEVLQLDASVQHLQDQIESLTQQLKSLMAYCHPNQEQQLKKELDSLKEELAPALEEARQQKLLQTKLNKLFELDLDNSNRPLHTFYQMAQSRLNAHVIGLFAAASGYLQYKQGINLNDDPCEITMSIFEALGQAALESAVGAAPMVGNAASILVSMTFQVYKDHRDAKKFKKMMSNYSGSLSEIDRQTRLTAYALTYLLQQQLPYCTRNAMDEIISHWIKKLSHVVSSAVNKPNNTNLGNMLKNKFEAAFPKKDLQTVSGKKKWNTQGLFEKAGIAYKIREQTICESGWALTPKGDSKQYSKIQKYGYLQFETQQEAELYKQLLIAKVGKTLVWQTDTQPSTNVHVDKVENVSTSSMSMLK